MRRRSGAVHCQTQQQLLELASNNEIGLYYDQRHKFREMTFGQQWTFNQAQNLHSTALQSFDFNEEQVEAQQQQKQLCKGKRYLQNCIVEKQTIQCSIQICMITSNIDQLIKKMVSKQALLDLFIHTKQLEHDCIYKHSTIRSCQNSNVFSVQKRDVECGINEMNKQNVNQSPKNWLKNSKTERMIQLLIVKKHINISQNSEIGAKRITIIHRIFIVNSKHLQNPLIKIYLQKCHYVINTNMEESSEKKDSPTKLKLYQKIFSHKSIFDKNCIIFDKNEFFNSISNKQEIVKFKNAFHKLQERIAKSFMRRLNELLIEQKRNLIAQNERN